MRCSRPVVARFLGWKPEVSDLKPGLLRSGPRPRLVAEWYDAAAAEPDDWLVEDYERTPEPVPAANSR